MLDLKGLADESGRPHGYEPTRASCDGSVRQELAAGSSSKIGREVRFRGQTGKHLFTLSLTAADHERLETWYHPALHE
jgi:hypothetical protein